MNTDIELFLIYGLGSVIVFFMIRLILVAQALLGLVFRQPSSWLVSLDHCPGYLQEFCKENESALLELGFRFSHSHVTEDMVKRKHAKKYYFVYYNDEKKTYASLTAPPQADSFIPVWIMFETYFADGTKCTTMDGVRHDIIDSIPDTVIQDGYTGSLSDQWALHLTYIENQPGQEMKIFPNSESGFRERLDYEGCIYRKYLENLERKGFLFKTTDEGYVVRTFAAVRIAGTMIKSMSKLAELKKKLQNTGGTVSLPIQLDVQNYQNSLDALNAKTKNISGKFLFLTVTLVLFTAVFSMLFSLELALILLAVIFIHEGGHLIAMYLFGYKDLRMLFVPLFGAVAMGTAKGIRPYKKIITYFAGPVPGIILAILLGVSSKGLMAGEMMISVILMLVIINYFNLLPVIPLDGGQILSTALFSRTAWLQTVFLGFSLVAMVVLGVYLSSPVLLIVAVALLFTYRGIFSQRRILQKLKLRFGQDRDIPGDELTGEILSMMKADPVYKNYPFQRKVNAVQQIENMFNTPRAPLPTAIVTIAIYTVVFILPVIYIVLPIMEGKPPDFLFPGYSDPCAHVRAMKTPGHFEIQSMDSRFKRIAPLEIEQDHQTNTVFRYCFEVNDKPDSSSMPPPPAPDFLARLWALYGKPDMIENGFAYTILDIETGTILVAYCKDLVPCYLNDNLGDNGVLASIGLFEKKLRQTVPADCELDIHLDYSKEDEERRQNGEMIEYESSAEYKLGSIEGKPYIKYIIKE